MADIAATISTVIVGIAVVTVVLSSVDCVISCMVSKIVFIGCRSVNSHAVDLFLRRENLHK